ncbi:unknown [Bacteroides sp. CAG:1060]|nr:unknown [Bacteroides sp. CAG:1060]
MSQGPSGLTGRLPPSDATVIATAAIAGISTAAPRVSLNVVLFIRDIIVYKSSKISDFYRKSQGHPEFIYCSPLMKRRVVRGSAMMAIVALIGRYMPKLTYSVTRNVISRSPTPMAEDIR